VFEGVAGFSGYSFNVAFADSTTTVPGALVSGEFYAALGLRPAVGRLIEAADDRPGAPVVAVVSDRFWERRLQRDPQAIGRAIRLNGVPVTIVGVSSPGFVGANVGSIADITVPVSALPVLNPQGAQLLGPGNFWLRVLARPVHGVTRAQTAARLQVAWRQIWMDVISPTWPTDRRLSFAGGVAILAEVFEQLGIESMRVADGAMREGLLFDLLGRYTDEDARDRTVRSMQERYHVDRVQAERVEQTAVGLLNQVEEQWQLTDPAVELLLRWAAQLHEIGLDVAHSGYHRHGAYLLANADMAGFPREEQKLLSVIVGGHRRKPVLEQADELAPPWDKRAPPMTFLLRLAVLLHRGRSSVALPDIKLSSRSDSLELRFPPGWLDDHPLTVADLQTEIDHLKSVGFRLRVFSAR